MRYQKNIGSFKFHTVGQGMFYTGIINCIDNNPCKDNYPYNFVYDCGAEPPKRFLEEAINNHVADLRFYGANIIEDKPVIDFAVISHLDIDHVIGLYDLKQKATIRKIYLPYIGDVRSPLFEAVFNYLEYSVQVEYNAKVKYSDEEQGTLEILIAAIRWLRNLYSPERNRNVEIQIIAKEDVKFDIPSNHNGTAIWKFHIFNKEAGRKKIENFYDLLETEFGKDPTAEKLLEDKAQRGKLNKIYRKAFGNSNITSLVLVHYPLVNIAKTHIEPFHPGYSYHESSNEGLEECPYTCYQRRVERKDFAPIVTVLTGDAEFDADMIDKLENVIKRQPRHNRLLQVPHHGSKANWDMVKKLKFDFDWYVIPFGYENKHSLPNGTVIIELQREHKKLAYVTQRDAFEYEIHFII